MRSRLSAFLRPCRMVRLLLERPTLLRQFEGQHLANLLWGLCRAGFRPVEPFLLAIAKARWCWLASGLLQAPRYQRAAGMPCLALPCLAGACAEPSACCRCPLAQEAELRVCDLKPQELFNLAWAFTQVCLVHGGAVCWAAQGL